MVSLMSPDRTTCSITIFGGAYEDENLLDSSELWTLKLPLPKAASSITISPVWTLVDPPEGPIPEARNEQVPHAVWPARLEVER